MAFIGMCTICETIEYSATKTGTIVYTLICLSTYMAFMNTKNSIKPDNSAYILQILPWLGLHLNDRIDIVICTNI